MTLPRPPISANTPIPNQPFSAEEVYYLEGNQGHLPLGPGLYINPASGEFTDIEPSPYIYCTPQFSELPVTYPPYGCETEVNTEGVTSFDYAWTGCTSIVNFPCVDSSSVTSFNHAWEGCTNMESFPKIDTSLGESFSYTWNVTKISSFPELNVSSGTYFRAAWGGSVMTSFPALDFSSGENFMWTWGYSPLLTSFPAGVFDNCKGINFYRSWIGCSLNQESVDNILVSLDTAGQQNGVVGIESYGQGQNSPPGPLGLAAKTSLQAKGWTVTTS